MLEALGLMVFLDTDVLVRGSSAAPAWLTSFYSLLLSLRLASGIGNPDCLIAAMALSRGARLYTFNCRD
jgi:hypothetical protein